MRNTNWKFRAVFLLQCICAVALPAGRLHAEPLIFWSRRGGRRVVRREEWPGSTLALDDSLGRGFEQICYNFRAVDSDVGRSFFQTVV